MSDRSNNDKPASRTWSNIMSIFKKQKFHNPLLAKLDGKSVSSVSVRDSQTYSETIIGKDGRINVKNGEIVILCNGHEVFRCDAEKAGLGEFLSLGGINITAVDKNDGIKKTIVAYYSSPR